MKICPYFERVDSIYLVRPEWRCAGTKNKEICWCGGRREYCTHHPELREKYINRKKVKPYKRSHLQKEMKKHD